MSLKEKLRNWLDKRWDYEIQCDIFEGLNTEEITKIAKLYDIDTSLSRLEICNKLSEILENKKQQYKELLEEKKCTNTMDPISGTDVGDIDPRELITILQNGQTYCFEIEGIYKNVFLSNNFKNPYTNVPFDEKILKYIEESYERFKTIRGKKFDKYAYASDTSITAVVGQLSNYLPYLSGIDKFLDASREKINAFLDNLEQFDVSLTEFVGLKPTKLKVSEDTVLREYKINLVKKVIRWIIDNQYTNVREAWFYTFENDDRLDEKLISAIYANASIQDIQSLIEQGADIYLRDLNERSLLHISIDSQADHEIFSYLIERGADINSKDMMGDTPLMIAVENKFDKEVEILLNNNADVSIENKKGETALYIASKTENSKDILLLLLKNRSTLDDRNIKKIILNILNNYDKEVLDVLIELYPDYDIPINKAEDTPLIYSIKNLLDKDIINMLIDEGSSLEYTNKSGDTALFIALKMLINSDIIKKLINLSNVNIKDKKGRTPLMIACLNHDIEIIKLILDKTEDINVTDDTGNTAYMYAKGKRTPDIIKLLVDSGAK